MNEVARVAMLKAMEQQLDVMRRETMEKRKAFIEEIRRDLDEWRDKKVDPETDPLVIAGLERLLEKHEGLLAREERAH